MIRRRVQRHRRRRAQTSRRIARLHITLVPKTTRSSRRLCVIITLGWLRGWSAWPTYHQMQAAPHTFGGTRNPPARSYTHPTISLNVPYINLRSNTKSRVSLECNPGFGSETFLSRPWLGALGGPRTGYKLRGPNLYHRIPRAGPNNTPLRVRGRKVLLRAFKHYYSLICDY